MPRKNPPARAPGWTPPKGRKYIDADGRWKLNGRRTTAPKKPATPARRPAPPPRDKFGRFGGSGRKPARFPKGHDKAGQFAPEPPRELRSTGAWRVVDSRTYSRFVTVVFDTVPPGKRTKDLRVRVEYPSARDREPGDVPTVLLEWSRPWSPRNSSWVQDLGDALLRALGVAGLTPPLPEPAEGSEETKEESSSPEKWRQGGALAVQLDGPEPPDDTGGEASMPRIFDAVDMIGEFWTI